MTRLNKRWLRVLVGGVVWAAAGIWFSLATRYDLGLASFTVRPVHSEFIDLMQADWVGFGKFLWPPIALGSDILVWVFGTMVWLLHPVGWPTAALAGLLAPHPALDTAVVMVGSIIGGIALCAAISGALRLLGRLPSRPR